MSESLTSLPLPSKPSISWLVTSLPLSLPLLQYAGLLAVSSTCQACSLPSCACCSLNLNCSSQMVSWFFPRFIQVFAPSHLRAAFLDPPVFKVQPTPTHPGLPALPLLFPSLLYFAPRHLYHISIGNLFVDFACCLSLPSRIWAPWEPICFVCWLTAISSGSMTGPVQNVQKDFLIELFWV